MSSINIYVLKDHVCEICNVKFQVTGYGNKKPKVQFCPCCGSKKIKEYEEEY